MSMIGDRRRPLRSRLETGEPPDVTPETAVTSARIYNALGQEIRVLEDPQTVEPGNYLLVWDGRDSSGHFMASGRYFLRVEVGSKVHSFQLALAR